jgi:hypothetical protein
MRYWFRKREGLKSKDLGWGYMPISWEGYLAVIVLIGLIIVAFFIFNLVDAKVWQGIGFAITVIILIIGFVFFAKSRTKDSMHWTRFHNRVYR